MESLDLDVELRRADFRLLIKESLDLAGITAVFGPSGSGKTSLLRVIAGLERDATGSIVFRSEPWLAGDRNLAPEERSVGFVFQDGRLFPHLNVRGNLEYALRHGRGKGPLALDSVVAAFDLGDMLDRDPASLSGGEQQRVAIARSLLAHPSLLLMDEPLSSLDLRRKSELIPLIGSLPERFGIPVLYVTHDVDELVQLADDVLLLANGRSLGRGNPRSILEHRDFERVAELADPGTVLEARVLAHSETLTTVELATAAATEAAAPEPGPASGSEANRAAALRIPRVRAEPGSPIRLLVHARDVILALEQPRGLSIRNSLAAEILSLDPREGGQVDVVLGIGAQRLRARITREATEELGLASGQSVLALIKTVALDGRGAS